MCVCVCVGVCVCVCVETGENVQGLPPDANRSEVWVPVKGNVYILPYVLHCLNILKIKCTWVKEDGNIFMAVEVNRL